MTVSVTLVRLDNGAYSTLDPAVDEDGYVVGFESQSLVGLYLAPNGDVAAVQTAAGARPNVVPLEGPNEEVTWLGKTFHCAACFARWHDLHVRPSAAIH